MCLDLHRGRGSGVPGFAEMSKTFFKGALSAVANREPRGMMAPALASELSTEKLSRG